MEGGGGGDTRDQLGMCRAYGRKRLFDGREKPQGGHIDKGLQMDGTGPPGLLPATLKQAELEKHVADLTMITIPGRVANLTSPFSLRRTFPGLRVF